MFSIQPDETQETEEDVSREAEDLLFIPYYAVGDEPFAPLSAFSIPVRIELDFARQWSNPYCSFSALVGGVDCQITLTAACEDGDYETLFTQYLQSPALDRNRFRVIRQEKLAENGALSVLYSFDVVRTFFEDDAENYSRQYLYVGRMDEKSSILIYTITPQQERFLANEEMPGILKNLSKSVVLAGDPCLVKYKADLPTDVAMNGEQSGLSVDPTVYDFADAFIQGDTMRMDEIAQTLSDFYIPGAYLSVVLPKTELLRAGFLATLERPLLAVRVQIAKSVPQFSEGEHTLIFDLSLAGVSMTEANAQLPPSDTYRALAYLLATEPVDVQPGDEPMRTLEYTTRFFTVEEERREGDEFVFTVRFWHDAARLIPSDLREYYFIENEGEYVLSGNNLVEKGTYPPGGWST